MDNKLIDAGTFLPGTTINLLKSNTAWGVNDAGWDSLILKLEKKGIAVIRASVNYSKLESDVELVKQLLTIYIQAQLMLPLINMGGLELLEGGEVLMEQFNALIKIIRENQKAEGIGPGEESTGVAGLIIF